MVRKTFAGYHIHLRVNADTKAGKRRLGLTQPIAPGTTWERSRRAARCSPLRWLILERWFILDSGRNHGHLFFCHR
jgi:hypothetical protein